MLSRSKCFVFVFGCSSKHFVNEELDLDSLKDSDCDFHSVTPEKDRLVY